MEIDTLAIQHGGATLQYRMVEGGYYVGDGVITLSVSCEVVGKDAFPPCAMLCLENHLISSPPREGDVFVCRGGVLVNSDEVAQRAWGYFTFHVDQITQRWKIESIEGDALVVSLEASHDDVNYHGAQARETTTVGLFKLEAKPLDQLWIPS